MGPPKEKSKGTISTKRKRLSCEKSSPDPTMSQKEEKRQKSKSLEDFVSHWSSDEDEIKDNDAKRFYEDDGDDEKENEEDESEIKDQVKDQKRFLSSLEKKDPEFYSFLQENEGDLLDFDVSDEENEEESEENDSVHKLPEKLMIDSDESDYEDERDSGKKLNKALLSEWKSVLESSTEKLTPSLLFSITEAFDSSVSSLVEKTRFRDHSSGALFNSFLRLVLTHMEGAFKGILRLDNKTSGPIVKNKHWSKIDKCLKSYSKNIIRLLSSLTELTVLTVLLKHFHSLISLIVCLPKVSKMAIKALVTLWSTHDEDSIRILSFMCILKLTQESCETNKDKKDSSLLESVMKQMYIAYVQNSKFVSPSSLGNIAFMRQSLSELMTLNQELTYSLAFVYIRALGIHLRNAITLQKKNSLQSVYNWQFIHSLHLWATYLGSVTHPSPVLEPLIYPLVQIIIGSLSLSPIPKYYPLRFHLCSILVSLTNETNKFIPILPYYTSILNSYNFNGKSKKVSMKPLDFKVLLKVSQSQLSENGFKDATMNAIYSGILNITASYSHKIGFPELVTPAIFTLKDFLKKVKVANYAKKIKQILDKIIENNGFLEEKRRKVSFGISDFDSLTSWELQIKAEGTPLYKFYLDWSKIRDHEERKMRAKLETGDNDDDRRRRRNDGLPSLSKKKERKTTTGVKKFSGDILEGSDDEDDENKMSFGMEENESEDEVGSEEESAMEIEENGKTKDTEETSDESQEDEVEELTLKDIETDED